MIIEFIDDLSICLAVHARRPVRETVCRVDERLAQCNRWLQLIDGQMRPERRWESADWVSTEYNRVVWAIQFDYRP